MGAISLLVLAVGLSMDAMAVAAARGLAAERVRARDVALIAGTFGGMQMLMPLFGWLAAERFSALIERWDHWIAFGVLTLLGGKMLFDAWRGDDDDEPNGDPFAVRTILLLGLATSIDALAAGVTLPLLAVPPPVSLVVIGVTTAVLSALGLFAGRRAGAALGARLEVLGGLALIGVGGKILLEHLLA
ncbi:MAG: manganese efflux pump [Deltaproteobacteria bacterium]|nr:manganese efflux pump [Deltaproteobacteria bacterium]